MAKQMKSLVESNPGAGPPEGALTAYVPSDYQPLYVSTPYVSFVSNKGSAFGKILLQIPGLDDGDPVLIRGGNESPVKLSPFRFYLLHESPHYSVVEETGELSESTFDAEVAKAAGRKFSEHIETVILVCLPLSIVPARCTFKTLKVRAAQTARKTLHDASGPTWAKLSAEHAATLVSPDPRFRFTTTVTLSRQTFKGTGRSGVIATGVPRPTSVADWAQVADFFNDPKACKLLTATVARHNERMEEIKGLVAG